MAYHIVVVDDEKISLTSARILLSEKGMQVSCLRSGKDLLKFMEKREPDLILLDVLMPEMDGFETYTRLRELEDEKGQTQVPVIFLTGENDSETERRGLKIGAADFIRKPFDQTILLKRIQNTIQNSKTIENLTEEATTDKLTGFLNKASGTERITELCSIKTGALMIFDLDSFKLVNDLFGHDMGDRVLKAFAEVFRGSTRTDDVVSRIGGDEFLGFFCDMTGESAVAALSKRLNEGLVRECEGLMGKDFGIPIGISVGAAFTPEHSTDYQTLFQYADSCLYKVKQNGKHGYEIYSCEEESTGSEEDLDREIIRLTQIFEERGEGKGALLLGQEAFSWNYRYVMRFLRRYGGKAEKLLFSLSAKEAGMDMVEIADAFVQALKDTLRKSDFIFQNRSNQFFLMLPEVAEENVPGIIERIMSAWKQTEFSQNTDVVYVQRNNVFSIVKKI